jgi:hypothetical protein
MIRELGKRLQVGFLYIVIEDLHETLAHADHWAAEACSQCHSLSKCPCLSVPIILFVASVLANISINLSISLYFLSSWHHSARRRDCQGSDAGEAMRACWGCKLEVSH